MTEMTRDPNGNRTETTSYLQLETMSLLEMGPQLKLPINVTKGSMPLQYNTYFSTNSCHLKYQNTCKFSSSSSDEGFDCLSPHKRNIHSILCVRFFVYKHGQQWQPKCIVEIVLINNQEFKVLIVNSGTKHDFKYEKRQ